MAFFSTEIDTSSHRSGPLGRLLKRMARAIDTQATTMSRRAQIEALEAKTDAELAEMGLKRDQIAYHVFHDLFYA